MPVRICDKCPIQSAGSAGSNLVVIGVSAIQKKSKPGGIDGRGEIKTAFVNYGGFGLLNEGMYQENALNLNGFRGWHTTATVAPIVAKI